MLRLIRRIAAECPRRRPTSDDELRSQQILLEELESAGASAELRPFRFNSSLYAVLALHFGLAALGSLLLFWRPWAAVGLHLLSGGSFFLDSLYAGYVLRRVFPFRKSQNLVATLAAEDDVALRIVLVAHADAAPTGWLFHPGFVRRATASAPPYPFHFFRKKLSAVMLGILALAVLDVIWAVGGHLIWPLYVVLSIVCLLGLILNLQVALRNQTVPGASDNLTGCAALPELAHRLAGKKPDNVELVFVVTGCEEAGSGGALALVREMRGRWHRGNTVIVGLDVLTNGLLRYKDNGETPALDVPQWLRETLCGVAAADPRWQALTSFVAPAGSDDVAPFQRFGYDGVCLCCIDPHLGVSRHYHLPTDTPENLDGEQLASSIDLAEAVVEAIIDQGGRAGYVPAAAYPRQGPGRVVPPTFADWWLWLVLGMLAGGYCAAMTAATWDAAFYAFRFSWLALMLLYPTFVVARKLWPAVDETTAGRLLSFVVMVAVGVSFAALWLTPLASAVAPGILGWSLLHLIGYGALCGLFFALPAAGLFRLIRLRRSTARRP